MRKATPYPPEFPRQMVDLVRAGRNPQAGSGVRADGSSAASPGPGGGRGTIAGADTSRSATSAWPSSRC
jgi:hypothetical protein